MTPWVLIATGLGAYTLALIATAPAGLVDAGLRKVSDGRLRLVEARGTLWSGSGAIEIRDLDGHTGIARSLSWRHRMGSLLHAQITYDVKFDLGTSPFPVTLSWSALELKNADINLPAAALGIGIPRLVALGLTGDMNLHVASLSLGRSATLGSATLQWLVAGSALSPISPLGNYELRLNGNGTTIQASLHTIQGPLQLDGQGSWISGRNPEFLATAYASPELQPRLAPFLRLIAIERAAGRFELRLK